MNNGSAEITHYPVFLGVDLYINDIRGNDVIPGYTEPLDTYWLAVGFLNDAPEGMMEDCIKLFVTENADGFAAFVEQAADSK